MGFRGQAAEDRISVFLGMDEFGEEHVVDREAVVCVIDQVDRSERALEAGIAGSGMRIFAKSEDMPPRRGPGMPITVDGKAYMVESWADEMGIAEVTCVRAM